MSFFEKILKDALRNVETEFESGELAYLALTQKVEHAFRDRLAYLLHKRLATLDSSFIVCREWLRADLAILKHGCPALILEAKAGYSFDIFLKERGYQFAPLITSDLEKAARLAAKSAPDSPPEIYALVVATHPKTAPSVEFRDAIKYFKSVTRFSVAENSFENINAIMNEQMNQFDTVFVHRTNGGSAFGVEVEVFSWLYRARVLETQMS